MPHKYPRPVLLLLALLCPLIVAAQTTLSGAEARKALATITAATASVRTLQADFRETQHRAMLTAEVVRTGRLAYAAPDKVRLAYAAPGPVLVINGQRVSYTRAGSGKTRARDAAKNKMAQRMLTVLTGLLTGRSLADAAQFTVQLAKTADTYTATLTPRKRELQQFASSIHITFDAKLLTATQIDIIQKNGDKTRLTFSAVKKNATIAPALFQTK